MALFIFTKKILAGEPIEVFNHGSHKRDFTYVDDIVESVCRITLANPPRGIPAKRSPVNPSKSSAPFQILNIGNTRPVPLTRYIELLENCLNKQAIKINRPFQMGDILQTKADISETEKITKYRPRTNVEVGIKRFVDWYTEFYPN
jgi:UDP-glucuronate 4-epimerase